MKQRILGIDTGTNSLGWAIVDYNEEAEGDKYELVDRGVQVFQEGVKIEKGIESSRAAERTDHKHLRVGYWRRKVRKIRLLTVLMNAGLCPPLPKDDLRRWRSYKIYPSDELFMAWQRTDELANKNPYYFRNLCLTEKLDMSDMVNRYIVGRAIYHINQRRGFLSNRKEGTKESDGAVIQGIGEISTEMEKCGCEYLGQYFYRLYQRGEKIRAHYTHRIEHYEKELLAICEKQGLDTELTKQLRKIIITQRPLKSQKHTVGHCVYEPSKPRCPQSHPLFEQYRMFAFINNIKIQTPYENSLRPLTDIEKTAIIPLFLRKSKKDFKFEEIAKKLSNGKNNYCYYKSREDKPYKFNYYMDTTVTGCPVIAQLADAFEAKEGVDDWLEAAAEVYTLGAGKTRYQIMNDIWHALFFFDDEEHLMNYAQEKLQLDDKHAEMFAKIRLPQDYAQLSLKAIRKILPYMKLYGMIYSHAVFLANITKIVDAPVDKEALLPMLPKDEADEIVSVFREYDNYQPGETRVKTREEYVKLYIINKYGLGEDGMKRLNCLYHPSMIETFPKVRKLTEKGYYQLGSPRTNSMRNPMAMHSLFRLRHVINTLLAKGKIDEDTVVRIEFARELSDSNRRAAIRQWQRENEGKRKEYADKIRETFGKDYEPTDTDILRYQLWEEQGHLCLYTGTEIRLADLFAANKYDIEHTVPRSVGGDSTVANLTLCQSKFNREVKKAQMPSQLANHEDILERIEMWKEKREELDKQIRKINTRGVADKGMKDRLIQKRHRLTLERDYWHDKYDRFVMTEVPEGFARRQGVDISIISRYARLYLKSLFRTVNIVKGITTAEFRRIWGLQNSYEKKERVNHCHHAIDAITIACIGKAEYDQMAQYYHDEERYDKGQGYKPTFPKPWQTFTEDVLATEQNLIVSHYTADNMPKHTRKRVRGTKDQYMQGDTARGSLHMDTYYGAILHDDVVRYVVRKPVDKVDPKNIVDSEVRRIVEESIAKWGSLKVAADKGIWMNEEKKIPIKKVRVYQDDVKQPLYIRTHRDVSNKEYKRTCFVKNDGNYLAAVFEGIDRKGKSVRKFLYYNNLEASTRLKRSNGNNDEPLVPLFSDEGYRLKYIIKAGALLLLFENSQEELYDQDSQGLQRRLYKVTSIDATNNRMVITHHQEARQGTDIPVIGGAYKQGEELRPRIRIMLNQLQALVEGQDFKLDNDGEIKFLHR